MQETPPLAHTDLLYRSHEEIRTIQNQRFRHQIALCFRAHPYYQEVFRRFKLTPDDFQTVEDVQKLPVTTKQDYLYPLTPFPHLTTLLPSGVMTIGASVASPPMSVLDPTSPNLDEVV